jgi:hypothetical protein
VRSRAVNGRELSYIEGWYAISQANRIFGSDGWSRETVDTRCVLARENRGVFLAVYTAKVRITVEADGIKVIREGHGSGEGRANSPGEVHDTALKAAETDATKRALATFGRPFGLELYRKDILSQGWTRLRPQQCLHRRVNRSDLAYIQMIPPRFRAHHTSMAGGIRLRPSSSFQKSNQRQTTSQRAPRWRPPLLKTQSKTKSTRASLPLANPSDCATRPTLSSLLRNPVLSAVVYPLIRITCALRSRARSGSK